MQNSNPIIKIHPNKTKKKFKNKNINNQQPRIRESEFSGICDKVNRSASPHGLTISRTNIKGRNNAIGGMLKGNSEYSRNQKEIIPNLQGKKGDIYDYHQAKSQNIVDLNRTSDKSELIEDLYSESPSFALK